MQIDLNFLIPTQLFYIIQTSLLIYLINEMGKRIYVNNLIKIISLHSLRKRLINSNMNSLRFFFKILSNFNLNI